MSDEMLLIALKGIGEIVPGDNLAEHIAAATKADGQPTDRKSVV